jgi:hypothetical protein
MCAKIPLNEIEFTVECLPEDMPIRGNGMASGDTAYDEQCAREIEAELAAGNAWAWCTIRVTGEWRDLVETAYLGCCSYASEDDFRNNSGYFDDMRAEIADALQAQRARICT